MSKMVLLPLDNTFETYSNQFIYTKFDQSILKTAATVFIVQPFSLYLTCLISLMEMKFLLRNIKYDRIKIQRRPGRIRPYLEHQRVRKAMKSTSIFINRRP